MQKIYTPASNPDDKEIQDVIAKNFRLIRKIKGLSLVEVGKILGCTGQQIQKYETGKNKISISTLVRFSNHLNISVSVFFNEIKLESFIETK